MTEPAIQVLLEGKSLFYAVLWKIERADSELFYFTDHDEQIEFTDGETYTPAGGFDATARQIQSGFSAENMDVTGVITDDAITEVDLKAGLFNDAKITETIIDWRYPWLGEIMYRYYWIVETTYTGEIWTAKMEGLTRWLTVKTGDIYTRTCRWDLGDSATGGYCTKTPTSENGTIYDVSSEGYNARRTFLVSGLTEDDGYYDYGYMTINGIDLEIESYTTAGAYKKIVLAIPSPIKLEVDETFVIYEGCDKLFETCIAKLGDGEDFGGFPDVPGTNKMFQTPTG